MLELPKIDDQKQELDRLNDDDDDDDDDDDGRREFDPTVILEFKTST